MTEKELVIVERLDDGSPKEKGCYRCTKEGCAWELKNGSRAAPSNHAKHAHEGSGAKIIRSVAYLERKEEDRIMKRSQYYRARYLRRKVGIRYEGGEGR